MVAFVTAILVLIVLLLLLLPMSKRRPPGTFLSWGEAMVAAVYTFLIFFWGYAVIPHLWLTWADNELKWRPDTLAWEYFNYAGFLKPQSQGGWFPFTISMQTIRDLVVVGIYVLLLGLNIYLWAWWNDRKKKAEAAERELTTSDYGRPLVRKG